MAQRKEYLDQYMSEARSLPSLYTSAQLQHLIVQTDSNAEHSGNHISSFLQKGVIIMITLTVVAGGVYAFLHLMQPAPPPVQPAATSTPITLHPAPPVLPQPNPPNQSVSLPQPSTVAASTPHPIRPGQENRHRPLTIPAEDIPGMNPVRLNQSEAEKLGIVIRNNGIEYYERYGREDIDLSDPDTRTRLSVLGIDTANPEMIFQATIAPNGVSSKLVPGATSPLFAPLLATNLHPDNGGFSFLFSGRLKEGRGLDEIGEELEKLYNIEATSDSIEQRMAYGNFTALNKLVPVLIEPAENGNNEKPWQVILWYYPTPEFLAALPKRISSDVQNELAQAHAFMSGDTINGTAIHPGEAPYLDIWRAGNGAINSSSVFPVPAVDDRLTLRYTLADSRAVSVTLHDIRGRHLRELAAPKEHSGGTYEEVIQTADLDRGIYLLAINTDRGEHAVLRIIVE